MSWTLLSMMSHSLKPYQMHTAVLSSADSILVLCCLEPGGHASLGTLEPKYICLFNQLQC